MSGRENSSNIFGKGSDIKTTKNKEGVAQQSDGGADSTFKSEDGEECGYRKDAHYLYSMIYII